MQRAEAFKQGDMVKALGTWRKGRTGVVSNTAGVTGTGMVLVDFGLHMGSAYLSLTDLELSKEAAQ